MRLCLRFLIALIASYEVNSISTITTLTQWISLNETFDFELKPGLGTAGLNMYIHLDQNDNYNFIFNTSSGCYFEINRLRPDVNSQGAAISLNSLDVEDNRTVRTPTSDIHFHWDKLGIQLLSSPFLNIQLKEHCAMKDLKKITGCISTNNVGRAYIDMQFLLADSLAVRVQDKDQSLENDIDRIMETKITLAIILAGIHVIFIILLIILIIFTRHLMKHRLKMRWKTTKLDGLYAIVLNAAAEENISNIPRSHKILKAPQKIMIEAREKIENGEDSGLD